MPRVDENMALALNVCSVILVVPTPAEALPPARRVSGIAQSHAWRWRAWLARMALALLAAHALSPRAWDADVMLRAAKPLGPQAVAGARALQAVLASAATQDEPARLEAINQFFNRRIMFASDQEVWGQEDYWATPLEMMGKGRGDCEDYVIGKYFSLAATGMPISRLRLVYVRATIGGPGGEVVAHMVLAYYAVPGAEPLILDNLIGEIRPASRRTDLEPVFSFNGEGLWQGVGAQSAGDPIARLSRWREVLAKSRAEGFP
jgi:predicted transglutaminase-like cysteine proteinase